MATFDLKDWRARSGHSRRWHWPGPSAAVMTDWLISAALCVGLAVCCPAGAALVVLPVLLSVSGVVWLMVAIVRAGPPQFGRRLTAWDAALFSFTASFSLQMALRLGLV